MHSTTPHLDPAALVDAAQAMADRFRAGGQLLVVATPAARADGQHVVVEFLHPVIVGKRALGALLLEPTTQRQFARPQDILLAIINPLVTAEVATALADAKQRGLLTVVLASQSVTGLEAEHWLRVPSTDPLTIRELQVTAYHLLWELVHTWLEQPGPACITCSDAASEVKIVELLDNHMARVETCAGQHEEISLDLVEAGCGDRVLVHAGVALEKLP